MKKNNSIHVIYIAGNGHSGSTLLDIILGSNEGCFSAGELTFITRDTIMQEYCSCKNKIYKCDLWSKVMELWLSESQISYEQYQKLQLRYERNKTTLRTLKNRIWPSKSFKQYCNSTLKLFEAIKKVTGKAVIIDSSKSPQRIAILSTIVDLQVIHICRDFSGVLNSAKKSSTQDMEAGIETDNPPRRTWKVLLDWITTNIATEIFCLGLKSNKVYYKNYVQSFDSLKNIHPYMEDIDEFESFSTPHMLAGNIIRLKSKIEVNPDVGYKYHRLGKKELVFSRAIDKIFRLWN